MGKCQPTQEMLSNNKEPSYSCTGGRKLYTGKPQGTIAFDQCSSGHRLSMDTRAASSFTNSPERSVGITGGWIKAAAGTYQTVA
ncbi:hypothetical protein P7K49_020153 [Saguinus oedipus]|uniref:Uncharacterized protein n=1 Tax=Saguinus oedipus TaxID=9490 RepID=A0ABQ9V044_SAGOE|nr:hypothetical protein P7K49_020153 [Saguinus oedipus]